MRYGGLALIAAGALCVVLFEGAGAGGGGLPVLAGQGLLLLSALMWAGFTIVARRSGLSPLHATAIVSTGSALLFLPVYFLFLSPTIQHAPWQAILVQGFYQGIVTSLLSLAAWTRAIAMLGPSRAAPFAALAPAMASLLAIPLLGEWPTLPEMAAVLFVSLGVPLASGLADRQSQS
jgi:drug/metabolite transporter (DMT)-like permease